MMTDVACVGIMVADIKVRPVTKIPERGLLETVDMIELHSGGNAMTAAININRLGLSASITGKVGCDSLGDYLISELEKNSVNTKNVARDKNTQTSASVVILSNDGERSFFHCVGADGAFRMSDVDWSVINEAKTVFVTGVFLLELFDKNDLTDFLRKCKELGKTTVVDVCWDSNGNWGKIINPAMEYIDIFMPSIDEARMIAEKTTPSDCAEVFFERGVKSVVIKLGSDGCYIQENKNSQSKILPCLKGIKAIDTTGAGDSFCSGFLAAYSKGKSFEECACFANAAGALCVTSMGAATWATSYEDTEKFMREHTE